MTGAKRRGARSGGEIPEDILEQLHRGCMATANLVEWLAVDQKRLLHNILKEIRRETYFTLLEKKMDALKKKSANTISKTIGAGVLELSQEYEDPAILPLLAGHGSDLVRCWAAYGVGQDPRLTLQEALAAVQPFAADGHFAVREIAWLAVRSRIAQDTHPAIELLIPWAEAVDENIRRFATEATRPRGVWCEHIEVLKQNPALGLPLLERLKSDPARYVQNSVANWLNDASKTRPDFVRATCSRWQEASQSEATGYIVKKALRTIEKRR